MIILLIFSNILCGSLTSSDVTIDLSKAELDEESGNYCVIQKVRLIRSFIMEKEENLKKISSTEKYFVHIIHLFKQNCVLHLDDLVTNQNNNQILLEQNLVIIKNWSVVLQSSVTYNDGMQKKCFKIQCTGAKYNSHIVNDWFYCLL